MSSFDKMDKMLTSFQRLADKVIAESSPKLSTEKIVKNFKGTGEYKRMIKGLDEEKISRLDEKIAKAADTMVSEFDALPSMRGLADLKPGTKKVEFIQFTDPEKAGGLDGGYLIPTGVYSSDKIKVVGPNVKKEDKSKAERIIVLGEYLTKNAFSAISG